MTDLRKAAEQALEALMEKGEHHQKVYRAAEALRQALGESANSTTNLVESKASSQTEQEPLGGEWVPCVKLPVIVHVRNQRNGETHISTREGITPVLPDDLIMRGVAGEEYPIRRELFERTYTFDVDNVDMSEEHVQKTDKSIHEPVGYVTNSGTAAYLHRGVYLEDDTPLYTAPPEKGCAQCGKQASDGWALYCVECVERDWVGLTADEIWKCNKAKAGSAVEFHICSAHQNVMDFAEAIEAKLKEKNGG